MGPIYKKGVAISLFNKYLPYSFKNVIIPAIPAYGNAVVLTP